MQRLRPIAADLGLTLAQLALAWVLRRPEVSSAIVGASRPEQLDENAGASGVRLDGDVARADRRGARVANGPATERRSSRGRGDRPRVPCEHTPPASPLSARGSTEGEGTMKTEVGVAAHPRLGACSPARPPAELGLADGHGRAA